MLPASLYLVQGEGRGGNRVQDLVLTDLVAVTHATP